MGQNVADNSSQDIKNSALDSSSSSPPIYELGREFYDPVKPALFPKQILRYKNESLNLYTVPDFTFEHLWSFKPLKNNIIEPLALRYHGHQFRHYNKDLGDGRGFLYAQVLKDNQWYDLGTKGSGTTPYSRQGDGRLTLKGAVREALATETLESYGVNTSKTACIYETGESLIRHDEPSPTRSAVLTRYSLGHIRIGTFQRLAFFNKSDEIKKLTKYVLKYYYAKETQNVDWSDDHTLSLRFLQCVSDRLSHLAAQVIIAGFVHGVLNSDNINVSGELFDYGPYRFLPEYNPQFTAAYFDHAGLYSFSEQPSNFLWNFAQLAQSLMSAYPDLPIQVLIENFETQFNDYLYEAFQKKLNVKFQDDKTTTQALSLFFNIASQTQIPYEEIFFAFHSARLENSHTTLDKLPLTSDLKKLISQSEVLTPEINSHPYFSNKNPETLLIHEIENIWKEIDQKDDWTLFNNKIQSLRLFRGCYKL